MKIRSVGKINSGRKPDKNIRGIDEKGRLYIKLSPQESANLREFALMNKDFHSEVAKGKSEKEAKDLALDKALGRLDESVKKLQAENERLRRENEELKGKYPEDKANRKIGVLSSGHSDDLIFDDGKERIWRSRVDESISRERLIDGRWELEEE